MSEKTTEEETKQTTSEEKQGFFKRNCSTILKISAVVGIGAVAYQTGKNGGFKEAWESGVKASSDFFSKREEV